MAFSLKLSEIADAISQISISGVTIRDRDQLAASWVSLPNVLYPNADEWITDFALDYQSLLRGTDAPVNVSYSLHYRFLGTQVGDMATFPKAYGDLVDKLIAIVNAMEAIHAPYSGAMDMQVSSVDIGPMNDPAGNQYFGADITLSITEIQN